MLVVSFHITLACGTESRPSQLFNGGFEQDTDNVGFADGWTVEKNAKVTLTREGVASGTRALVIEEGYNAVSQELNITNMAGKRVNFSIDAKSPDGGFLGVRMGHYVEDAEGKRKWRDIPVIWDQQLGTDYQTIRKSFVLPKTSLDGRFWICLYRSKRSGTVIADNVVLELLDEASALNPKEAAVLGRERGYLLEKINTAEALQPQNSKWSEFMIRVHEVYQRANSITDSEQGIEPLLQEFKGINAEILAELYGEKGFTVAWKNAYERMDPAALPAVGIELSEAFVLPGEHVAFGIEISNTTTDTRELIVELPEDLLKSVSQVEVRRQVLMETWYTKGATLVADALTALPYENADHKNRWKLALEKGETTRLYVDLKIEENLPQKQLGGDIVIWDADHRKSLPYRVNVIQGTRPTTPELAHYQFLYMIQNVANRIPEQTKDDLEAHGVTDIEWAFIPTVRFTPEGELAKISYGAHERWLRGFKDSKIRLNLFWMKKLLTENDEELELYSSQWMRAWGEVHKAYLAHAESIGLERERFTVLPMDEIHSKNYENAPDENIEAYLKVAKGLRDVLPGLPQYLTVGNYAFPVDIQAVVHTLDVAIVHWPRPVTLSRNAPAGYQARKDFFENTLPVLESAREAGNLQIWSYHVQSGRNANVLLTSLAYPIFSVVSGYTGFGYWAYNVSNKSTWDDTDGNLLDYVLVYDGSEQDPKNLKYNVTKEQIIPSIRWKAIRAGQQDAQILLHLMDLKKQGKLSAAHSQAVKEIVEAYEKIAGEFAVGTPELSYDAIRENGNQLRKIYARISSEK